MWEGYLLPDGWPVYFITAQQRRIGLVNDGQNFTLLT